VHSSDAVERTAVDAGTLNLEASQILRRKPALWEALARILVRNFASVSTAAYHCNGRNPVRTGLSAPYRAGPFFLNQDTRRRTQAGVCASKPAPVAGMKTQQVAVACGSSPVASNAIQVKPYVAAGTEPLNWTACREATSSNPRELEEI